MTDPDAERKAKAARAKKLLAARQKERAKANASTQSPTSTSVPEDSAAPSVRTSLSLDGSAREERKEEERDSPSDSLATLQETVSLLIKERTDLQGQVADLQRQLATAKGDTQLLDEGRALISRLEEDKRDLESRLEKAQKSGQELDSLKEESRRLKGELHDLRGEKKHLQAAVKEAQGQAGEAKKKDQEAITELEKSIKRARERESGLEAEVARLRQSHSELSSNLDTITTERDQLRSSSSANSSTLGELRQSNKSLKADLDTLRAEHSTLKETHSTLQTSHEALTTEHNEASSSRKTLDGDLSKQREEVTRLRGQLEESQGKADGNAKRAEAAERKRTALQEENAELVKQLEEVRGRVVQVLDEKVDLAARLEEWERKPKLDQRVVELEKELEARTTSPPTDDSVSTLRAAHTLELSRQAEQIRHLEASLHASTSRVHSLSRELFEAQRSVFEDGPRSPQLESRFSVDSLLPANVRHKRQVSLAALKARMDHSSSKMDKITEDVVPSGLAHSTGLNHVRKQFGDEIVFCCPACDGDLITV